MTGDDWTNCGGEVFTVMKSYPFKNGIILVGDKVSLHPTSSIYLRCEEYCQTKNTCTFSGYYYCDNTAVWTIYAKGKAVGETIVSGDDVSLRYDNQEWLSVGTGDADLTSCLGQTLPPPYDVYDGCSNEHFTLWIKP